MVEHQTLGPGAGFTSRIITTPDSDIAEDRIVTAIGTYSATASLNPTGNWVMQMATFKAGGSVPPSAPTVSSVAPATGPTTGGTPVTLTGTNFVTGATVTFGGTAATNVNVTSSTSISATTPAHAAGAVTVVVTNPDGQSGTLASGFTYTLPPPDTQPPTAPSNVTAAPASATQINLAWTASTDNVGVTGYRVERCQGAGCSNFAQIATLAGTTFNNTGLTASTSYSYRVRAIDATGNLSLYSNTASATTLTAQPNPIVIENQQPGTTEWELGYYFFRPYGTDEEGQIKGYASATSVNKGESITFQVSVNPAQTYTIDVYRLGWYQGLGGRLMQHIGPLNGVQQPPCPTDATTGMVQCNWTPAYNLVTQSSWTSGVYVAVLKNAQNYYNYVLFVVRDDSRVAALLYQQPVTAYQAFNNYPDLTGKSLYEFNSYGATTVTGTTRAAKVSFDRPYASEGYGGLFETGEINLLRWIERSGYDVTYSTNVDTHTNGDRLLNYRGFLSVPHDEYWSKPMYDAVIAARDAGVNLAFFGANSNYWQVRFEASSSGVPNRVIVCYKFETTPDTTHDPVADPSLRTVRWRDPPVNRPEQTLVGIQYSSILRDNQVPYVVMNSGHWVYAGTGFKDGDSVPMIVGYEGDRMFSEYPLPNAVNGTYALLSHSPYIDSSLNPDYANSSIYQAQSGAWVFAAGTMDWSWALDDIYDEGYTLPTVDARIQQATRNILDRFVAD
jgi:hypothetical protein